MNLLSLLTNSLTSDSSLNSLSQATGISQQSNQSVVSSALPLLMQALTNNASTQSGAQSLLGALTQHTSTQPVAQQIATADTDDGAKILEHIFGKNAKSVYSQIAKETGTSSSDVKKILSYLAPTLLSSLSSATTTAAQAQNVKPQASGFNLADGFGMNDVMGLLGNAVASNSSSSNNASALSSLAGALLGGGNTSSSSNNNNGAALLTSLLGSMLK